MLTPLLEKEKELIIKNVVSAIKDIDKLNKRGYQFLNLSSGFIAHYDLSGFIDYYRQTSLKEDILNNQPGNQWDNFEEGEKDYEYYHQKGEIYQTICAAIKDLKTELKACFCPACNQRIS